MWLGIVGIRAAARSAVQRSTCPRSSSMVNTEQHMYHQPADVSDENATSNVQTDEGQIYRWAVARWPLFSSPQPCNPCFDGTAARVCTVARKPFGRSSPCPSRTANLVRG